MIKADNKIVHTEKGENQTTYILQNDTHISDSFEYLPNGRIDKRVTGIGATYSELKANRHSIIVEPLRAIASFKAYKHDAIYVGSKTKYHNKPLSTKNLAESVLDITVTNKPVKIMVVADSLPRVIEALGINFFKDDFFFMVDEIDTFQVDSGYRESLEQVIDIYFKFKNRCVVSATLREFTNPKLKN